MFARRWGFGKWSSVRASGKVFFGNSRSGFDSRYSPRGRGGEFGRGRGLDTNPEIPIHLFHMHQTVKSILWTAGVREVELELVLPVLAPFVFVLLFLMRMFAVRFAALLPLFPAPVFEIAALLQRMFHLKW